MNRHGSPRWAGAALVLSGDLDLQAVAETERAPGRHCSLPGRQTTRRRKALCQAQPPFQTAATGRPDEYLHREEAIAPPVLETIANWLRGSIG